MLKETAVASIVFTTLMLTVAVLAGVVPVASYLTQPPLLTLNVVKAKLPREAPAALRARKKTSISPEAEVSMLTKASKL